MIRVVPKFNVQDIRAKHIKSDGSIYVIGHENSKLLLAHDTSIAGKDGQSSDVTCIYMYDMEKEEATRVYTHSSRFRCVGASLDASCSILALTSEDMRPSSSSPSSPLAPSFRTSLAEVLPSGESYRLNVRSPVLQHVQFVGTSQPSSQSSQSSSSSSSSSSLFLFIIEGMFVRLYQMHSRRRLGGGVKITAQPVLVTELCKRFQWWHWCHHSQRLFILLPPSSSSSSSQYPQLKCYAFPKKEKLLFDVPIIEPSIASLQPDWLRYTYLGRPVPSASPRLVCMPDGGLCMVVQQPQKPSSSSVPIVVLSLHHACRITVDMPVSPNAPLVNVSAFSVGKRLLLLWIPGHSCCILDAGLGRPLFCSLSAVGAAKASALPRLANPNDDLLLLSLDWTPAASTALSCQSILFHPNTGSAFQCELDRVWLLDVLQERAPRLHLHALHVACSHSNDPDLCLQMLVHALSSPKAASAASELLSEWIIAMTHVRLSQDPRLPPSVLQVLPITTLPSLPQDPSAATESPVPIGSCTLLPGITATLVRNELQLTPSAESLSSSIEDAPIAIRAPLSGSGSSLNMSGNVSSSLNDNNSLSASPGRLNMMALSSPPPGSPGSSSPFIISMENSPSSSSSSLPNASSSSTSGMSRLVQFLFGREDSDSQLPIGGGEGEGADGAERVSVCRMWGAQWEEHAGDQLHRILQGQETKARCLKHARLLRRAQQDQVMQAWKCVQDAEKACGAEGDPRSDGHRFHVLQSLHCVLEEMSLPLPPTFSSRLACMAARCLPSRLFVQMVDRGALYLSDACIVQMLQQQQQQQQQQQSPVLASTAISDDVRFCLVSRIRDVSILMQQLWSHPAYAESLLLPHLSSQTGVALPDQQSDVDALEGADDAPFIPLALFRHSVRMRNPSAEDEKIIQFVYDMACKAIRRRLTPEFV